MSQSQEAGQQSAESMQTLSRNLCNLHKHCTSCHQVMTPKRSHELHAGVSFAAVNSDVVYFSHHVS